MKRLAEHASMCPWCDVTIREGDEIAKHDGEWLHAMCAELAREA